MEARRSLIDSKEIRVSAETNPDRIRICAMIYFNSQSEDVCRLNTAGMFEICRRALDVRDNSAAIRLGFFDRQVES